MFIVSFVLLAQVAAGPSEGPIPSTRRDPFVRPELWYAFHCDTQCRIAYLEGVLGKAGFAARDLAALRARPEFELYPRPHGNGGRIDWDAMERDILEPGSLARGQAYYERYRDAFDSAEKTYGVSATALVALIRIESNLGEFLYQPEEVNPRSRVFNALYSQALQDRLRWYPRLGKYSWQVAAEALATFLVYCRDHRMDPFAIRGSWAGAFGLIQFMPYNIAPYGVDGDRDGIIDLFNPLDAIPSAAHFLMRHGWADNPRQALVRYYGEASPYQRIAERYEAALDALLGRNPRSS